MDNYLQFALIALIFSVVGYLIGKMSTGPSEENKIKGLKLDLEDFKQKNTKLQSEIDKMKLNISAEASNFVGNSNTNNTFDAKAIKAVYGKSFKQNDLKIINGISEKIEELYKTSGILTWKALSETSVDRLREILSKAGEKYLIHDPRTWPSQSKLAYQGKWQELKNWQNALDGGREV